MAKKLFKTNVNALRKVTNKLALSQTMTHSQVILSKPNQQRLDEALALIRDAMNTLDAIV